MANERAIVDSSLAICALRSGRESRVWRLAGAKLSRSGRKKRAFFVARWQEGAGFSPSPASRPYGSTDVIEKKNFQKICEISDRREMALFNGRHQATAGFKRRHGLGRIDAGDGEPANAGHSFSTASAFPQQLARSGAFPRRLILPWFLSVGISVAQAVQCRRWVHRLAQNSYRISTCHSRAVLSSEVVTTPPPVWTELR
jgi:hypothetical protein